MEKLTQQKLHKNYLDLLQILQKDYNIEDLSRLDLTCREHEGEATVVAFPIQGVLKYHGMRDPQERIAYFSSISLNNGAAATITYIHLSRKRATDILILNGAEVKADSQIFQRVKYQLEQIRKITKLSSKALIISRNVYISQNSPLNFKEVKEKGLGTSASAGAAIAAAIMHIIYPSDSKIRDHDQVRSIFARFLAGSAARSATGGFSLWVSHPLASSWESFSIRLDLPKDEPFIQELSLLTIPIKSSLKTEHAHKSVLKSPFYEPWLNTREDKIEEFIKALRAHDFNKMGELMEEDTLALHAVSMTTGIADYILAWEPETLSIMKKIRNLRTMHHLPVYYSIDTGPTVVVFTLASEEENVIRKMKEEFPSLPIIQSKIQGSPRIIHPQSREYQTIQADISKFKKIENDNKHR